MKKIASFLLITLLSASCRKYEPEKSNLSAMVVVNAVFGAGSVQFGSRVSPVDNNTGVPIGISPGNTTIYIWPTGDSSHPYYVNPKFATSGGELYSLFLTGTSESPENILIKENIPFHTDSTAGIRFVNLAEGSNPLNITLAESPTVNEVTSLAYKNYTDFKIYPGLSSSSYVFEVRDATVPTSDAPLTTFTLSGNGANGVPRFANIALVISKSDNGVSVFRVNYDR